MFICAASPRMVGGERREYERLVKMMMKVMMIDDDNDEDNDGDND